MKQLFFITLFFFINAFGLDSSPLKGVATDVEKSVEKVKQFKKRDERIWKFKIEVSDLITTNPTGILGQVESKNLSQQLSSFYDEMPSWKEEAKKELERLLSLGVLIAQNKKIQKEIISNKNTDDKIKEKSKHSIQNVMHLELTLKGLIKKTKEHVNNLEKFQLDIDRWNKYLIKTIRQDVGQNLFTWKINNFILAPLVELDVFVKGIRYDIEKSFSKADENLISTNLNKIVFMSIILILLLGLILYYSDYIYSKYGENLKNFQPVFSDIVQKIFKDRLLLIVLVYLFFWIKFLVMIIPEIPKIINVLSTGAIVSYLWIRFGAEILKNLNNNQANTKIKISMIVFIFVKLTILNLSTESEFLFFLSSLLILFLSVQVFQNLVGFFKNLTKVERREMSILFRSALYLIILFSVFLFSAGFLEVIGFGVLSRLIQGIVFNNLITFTLVWAFYHFMSTYLYYFSKKDVELFEHRRNFQEFFQFIQSGFNTFTVITISLFVIKTWAENLFIFESVWDLKLFSLGDYKLTLWRPIGLIVAFYIIKAIYLITSYSIDSFWLHQFKISKKYSPNIKTLSKYCFVILYFGVSFGILGFTYKNIVIFASALGVGIGFGLQNIVNNFISGIILLFERPIRVGDMIEVNEMFCRVCQIGIRSTVVETIDNSSIVIPNSEIISNRLVNWTLNSNVFAINCTVGVEYGTDTRKVKMILTELLKEQDFILKEPVSQVWFEEFGDSSLNFKIKFWIDDPNNKYQIRSNIMHLVNESFIKHDIKIPFPQRDLHLKTSAISFS